MKSQIFGLVAPGKQTKNRFFGVNRELERLSELLAIVRLPGADPMMTAAEAQSGCRAAVRAGPASV